jgi:hypothetical protein
MMRAAPEGMPTFQTSSQVCRVAVDLFGKGGSQIDFVLFVLCREMAMVPIRQNVEHEDLIIHARVRHGIFEVAPDVLPRVGADYLGEGFLRLFRALGSAVPAPEGSQIVLPFVDVRLNEFLGSFVGLVPDAAEP